MATAAGFLGDIPGIQGRACALRIDDQVLAVAIDANGRISHSGLDGFAVHALVELARDFLVALRAGLRHLPVIDPGAGVGGGIDVMRAVATGTGGRVLAESDRASVDALLVRIDRMGDRNFVARQERCVAVALGASVGQILTRDGGVRFAGGFHRVDGTVTGHALRRVGVAFFRGLPVDAGFERFQFVA